MVWRWGDDTDNQVSPGAIVAISASVVLVTIIGVVVAAKRSLENACFRFFDRNLGVTLLIAFVAVVATIVISTTTAELGSKLPIAICGSLFLALPPLIGFFAWRASKRRRANEPTLYQGDGDDTITTVYVVPVDCASTRDINDCRPRDDTNAIDICASELPNNLGGSGVYSTMTHRGGGFDGGSSGFGGASGTTRDTTTCSSTGDSGGGYY